jgi:very-short-patch-repair endonuclease
VREERRTPIDHGALASLATAQHGVVSATQLAELGYSHSAVGRLSESGRLHRIHRGVYAVGHTDLDHQGRVMAQVLANAPAVASHWTAAWLHGLTRTNTSIHLTAPTRRHRRPGFRVHYANLAPEDVCAADSIPLTSLARTILDLAPLVDAKRLDRFISRAEELRLFDLRDFESLLARTSGHRGHAPLDAALRLYRPDLATTRSNLERDFRALVRAHDLPAPAMNHIVGPYEIDAYWPEERFGVELDVFATHGSRLSFEEDRRRADDLLGLGVEITRVTDLRLEREPQRVVESLAGHLARRRRTAVFN